MNSTFHLSKSSFMRGIQCKKALWLHFNQPEERDDISDSQEYIFETGHSVGELAQQRFAGGMNASRSETWKVAEAVAYTQELIEQGQEVIYEGAFLIPKSQFASHGSQGDLLCYIDILVKEEDGWAAYEVKASTGVKEYHVLDVAFQYLVITGSGFPLKQISLVHLNNQYVRRGELDLEQLFTIVPMTEKIQEMQEGIHETTWELIQMLQAGIIPEIEMGRQCANPFPCDFLEYCRRPLPWPLPKKGGEGASRNQEALNEFIDELEYPLYFMDFETLMFAVPQYDESRAYQKVPFQWSLHVGQVCKVGQVGQVEHFEFLGIPPGDPRREFVESLLEVLGEQGSIIVWNKTFEMTILRELARDFPEFAKRINLALERVVDLMVPFRKRYLYLPEMNGSYSLKAVLPTLVPELSYSELDIQEGNAASLAYEQLYREENPEVVAKIRQDLLEYCKLDTWAMVRILQEMRNWE